ncbi:trypsin-like serine peptidase [Bacillus halotolerans]|uniref:trypsin-like serine peptidase n=1 Tax=Bacillus halotolerans TaxID=260554 RepID=UPI0022316744|nr:serine protease [Bacillus halotolerans]UZD52700.1 serine protease [Bacillus halotolerans]
MKKSDKSKIVGKLSGESSNIYIAQGQGKGQTSYPIYNKNSNNESSNYDHLPTIEELEGLKLNPEDICGSDERANIQNTKIYPWSAICQLIITRSDGSRARATGWFNGKGTVITAGHCVYSQDLNTWNKTITVIPGKNGSEEPFGQVSSENLWSVEGWTKDKDPNYDYGAIILPTQLGNNTGYFGFGVFSDSILINTKVNLSGYPGDKPNTQWAMYEKIESVNARKVEYMIDTIPGHSGSPIWFDEQNGQHYAVGIHAYGGCPNSGTRINHEVFNNLMTWRELGNQN